MASSYLRADCLYTGISSGPNARWRVWENFTFTWIEHSCPTILRSQLTTYLVSVFFSARHATSYEHDIRFSLFVTLGDSDHGVQKNGNRNMTWQNKNICWLYLHAEADPDRNIHWSGYEKRWSFALQRHPTTRVSRYLSICWASWFQFIRCRPIRTVALTTFLSCGLQYKFTIFVCLLN